MPLDAHLARLELSTPDVNALADFYRRSYGMQVEQTGAVVRLTAPGRELRLREGPANQFVSASFRMARAELLAQHREHLGAQGVEFQLLECGGHVVKDPEGRELRFLNPKPATAAATPAGVLPGRLQHYAVRTPDPQRLVDFYVERLGFTLSDRVVDDQGGLGAAFLRTDHEHHTLAIFRAPVVRFDHFSCETDDWETLRDWADHMAEVDIMLAWGVGRHGPGNDNFFMVADPDGNLAEISCDLEVCAPDRPVGLWKHRPQTLNRWGVAIMRS